MLNASFKVCPPLGKAVSSRESVISQVDPAFCAPDVLCVCSYGLRYGIASQHPQKCPDWIDLRALVHHVGSRPRMTVSARLCALFKASARLFRPLRMSWISSPAIVIPHPSDTLVRHEEQNDPDHQRGSAR